MLKTFVMDGLDDELELEDEDELELELEDEEDELELELELEELDEMRGIGQRESKILLRLFFTIHV